MAIVDHEPGWRTTRSIRRTNCGTKKTNVKMPNPRNAWENTWRQMYRSISRIDQSRHSSTLTLRGIETRASVAGFSAAARELAAEAARR
jgi:hypothetical protein